MTKLLCCKVVNPSLLSSHCSSVRTQFSSDTCRLLSRYIPTARLQYEYPGQYRASDSQSCASDSNLLLHDDPDHYNDPDHYDDPYADLYEDKSDSQQGRCPAEEAELRNQEAAAAATGADDPAEEAERLQNTKDSCQDSGDGQRSQTDKQQDDSLTEQSVGTDVKR